MQSMLDIAAAADPMPLIATLRGGRIFVVDQSEISVAECRAMMDRAGIHYDSEQVMPSGDTRIYIFRVPDEDAPLVRDLLGYANPAAATETSRGSLWWLWAIVILCILGAACTVAMMAMGGA